MKEIKTEKKARKTIEIVRPNKETGQELEVILVITLGWRIFGFALLMATIATYLYLKDPSMTSDSILNHMEQSSSVKGLFYLLLFFAGIANVLSKSAFDIIRNFLSVALLLISFAIFTF